MMSVKELMDYSKGRFKTYNYHEMSLKDVRDKSDFEKCRTEFLSDYFDDVKLVFDIDKSKMNMPEPVAKSFAALKSYANNTMDVYARFKILMGY